MKEGKGGTILAVLWIETALSLAVIALRYYTRRNIGGRLGWDDLLLMITWLLFTVFTALCSASVSYGMGVHVDLLTPYEARQGTKLLLVGQSVIAVAIGVSKCAVATFLLRIVVDAWQKAVLWFWMVSMMGLSLLLAVTVFVQCSPVESLWDSRIKGHCVLNLTTIAKITCAWAATMDFFLAIFPWAVLWQLNMKRKEKITICCSLSLGVIAGMCGVIRTTGLDALASTSDYLYATSDSVCWTTSELTLTIICVCIPSLRPLWNRITGQSSSGGAGAGAYYTTSGANKSKSASKSKSRGGGAGGGDAFDLDYMTRSTVRGGAACVRSDSRSDRSILGACDKDGEFMSISVL